MTPKQAKTRADYLVTHLCLFLKLMCGPTKRDSKRARKQALELAGRMHAMMVLVMNLPGDET